MSKSNAYRDDCVHVQKAECETCIFRKGNIMQLQPGRVREMVDLAKKNDSAIICHKTIGTGKNAICRGFWDRYETLPIRLAKAFRVVVEDD